MEAVFSWISQYGYAALFTLLMLGVFGLPVPDETILVFCGYLIWKGRLRFDLAFLAGVGGSICGISLSYVLGRAYGARLINAHGRRIGLTPKRLEQVHQWFERMGSWLLVAGYFIPAVRHFTAVVAGTSGLEYRPFALFAYLGAAVWVLTFISLGYVVGERWEYASELVHRYGLAITAIAAASLGLYWFLQKKKRV